MGASRTMSFGAPGRYIQGPGEINRVSVHTKKYGSSVFAVIDPYFFASMHDLLKRSTRLTDSCSRLHSSKMR